MSSRRTPSRKPITRQVTEPERPLIPLPRSSTALSLGAREASSPESSRVSGYQQNSLVKPTAVPVVSLHNISPSEVIANRKAGKYDTAPAFLSSTSLNPGRITLTGAYSVSRGSQTSVCVHTDVTGVSIRSVTTGNDAFEGRLGGECYYCRYCYETEGFGFAIKPATCVEDKVVFFTAKKNCCSPECLLAYLDYINLTPETRRAYRDNTLDMLWQAFSLRGVKPARDFELLQKNGGTETYESWSSSRVTYVRAKGVVVVPTKYEYYIYV